MNPEKVKTYLVLKYGSMFNAHRRWQMNQCFSEEDDKLISKLIQHYLSPEVDKR